MKFFKKLDRKGFTLAEMLIVMAVVVILAAATMPAINGQVETARETNDIDAIRAAYIDAYTAEFMTFNNTGAITSSGVTRTVKLSQKVAGWSTNAGQPTIDGQLITFTATSIVAAGNTVTFTFEPDTTTGGGIKVKTIEITS